MSGGMGEDRSRLRGAVARRRSALRRFGKTVRFALWSLGGRLRHGPTRWLRLADGQQVLVRVDDFRAYRIASAGGTQQGAIRIWQAMVDRQPTVAVDVGANHGELSRAVVDRCPHIVAIEANPDVQACLMETLRGFPQTVVLHLAASDHDGTITFFPNRMESGSGSMTATIVGPKLAASGRVVADAIPCRTLSSLLPEVLGATPPSVVMKMDVEGFEQVVMRGAEPLLAQCAWWLALLEFNPGAIRRAGLDPAEVWAYLRTYAGVAIEEGPDACEFSQTSRLAAEAPTSACDVLIGAGLTESLRLG